MNFHFIYCVFVYSLINLIFCDEIKIVSHNLSEKEKTESLGISLSAIGLSQDINVIANSIIIGLKAQFGSHWNCFITTDKNSSKLRIEDSPYIEFTYENYEILLFKTLFSSTNNKEANNFTEVIKHAKQSKLNIVNILNLDKHQEKTILHVVNESLSIGFDDCQKNSPANWTDLYGDCYRKITEYVVAHMPVAAMEKWVITVGERNSHFNDPGNSFQSLLQLTYGNLHYNIVKFVFK